MSDSDERAVVVRLTVEYVKAVPADWDAEQINSIANGSGRCIDNSIHELAERSARWGEWMDTSPRPDEDYTGIRCFCEHATEVYVREASEREAQALAEHEATVREAEAR